MTSARPDPGSFRDPTGRVVHLGERVLRGLDERAAADWAALSRTRFFGRAVEDGRIIGTRPAAAEVVAEAGLGTFAAVLEHERVPFVSYPYEWTFEMARAAAVLHLDLVLAALDEGLTTKDGSAFNVQFLGARPVFIDVGSFQVAGADGPWVGYQQFCRTMLYPLLLQAHLDVPFQRYLLGHLDGIPPADMRRLLGGRHTFRKGVFQHVTLLDVLSSRVTESAEATRERLRGAGGGADLTRATVRKLRDLVVDLRSRRSRSGWADYRATCSYSDADTEAKRAFVGEHVARLGPSMVWDLGCNDGAFARLAAPHAGTVVAVDADDVVVDAFYLSLQHAGEPRTILPLVVDLTDPSPGRGWRNLERQAFLDRGRPDLVLALALVHHLAIGANVPLAEVLEGLRSLGAAVLVEFVDPRDPMAARLLANKPPGTHDDYRTDRFEALLAGRFDVAARADLPGGTRRLYLAHPRPSADRSS